MAPFDSAENKIHLASTSPEKYGDCVITFNKDTIVDIDNTKHDWGNYFRGPLKVCVSYSCPF